MSDPAHAESFTVTERNRVRRVHDRGRYDKASIYPILDAAMLSHIAYVIDGEPFCTPTSFWREGDTLYWHGSSASRMIRQQKTGIPVCLTVTHMDAIVLARSGFHHSVNYRSVMAWGHAQAIEGREAKLAAMDAFVDRFFPGRSKLLRAPNEQEIKATTIMWMEIEQASGKIRDTHVSDEEEDYTHPVWTALIPLRQVVGEADPCPRSLPDVARGGDMSELTAGRTLDDALTAAYQRTFK